MKRILVTLLILVAAVAAFAQNGPRPGTGGPMAGAPAGPGPGGPQGPQAGAPDEVLPPPLLAEFLGLSEAQIEQVKAIHEQLRTTVQPLAEQMRTYQEQVKTAVEAGNALQAGEALIAANGVREQIEAARAAADAAFEALLTADQLAKWDVYQEIVELRRARGPRA